MPQLNFDTLNVICEKVSYLATSMASAILSLADLRFPSLKHALICLRWLRRVALGGGQQFPGSTGL